jgi:hypothetical protein
MTASSTTPTTDETRGTSDREDRSANDSPGDNLLAKVKEIVHEGNVRRVTISNEEGQKLIEIPLTVGVVGVLLLPVWAAIGAIAAVVTNAKIEIERVAD